MMKLLTINTMKTKSLWMLTFALLSVALTSCEVVGDIFGAGVSVGIFLVIAVIVIVLIVLIRIFRRR